MIGLHANTTSNIFLGNATFLLRYVVVVWARSQIPINWGNTSLQRGRSRLGWDGGKSFEHLTSLTAATFHLPCLKGKWLAFCWYNIFLQATKGRIADSTQLVHFFHFTFWDRPGTTSLLLMGPCRTPSVRRVTRVDRWARMERLATKVLVWFGQLLYHFTRLGRLFHARVKLWKGIGQWS